jgi:hypothetical protein
LSIFSQNFNYRIFFQAQAEYGRIIFRGDHGVGEFPQKKFEEGGCGVAAGPKITFVVLVVHFLSYLVHHVEFTCRVREGGGRRKRREEEGGGGKREEKEGG